MARQGIKAKQCKAPRQGKAPRQCNGKERHLTYARLGKASMERHLCKARHVDKARHLGNAMEGKAPMQVKARRLG
jgi:hypothetical protein